MRARASRHLHNVPAELTSFVGRRRELAELRERLVGARLVTLTGPGGVGKTRLAIRAASEMARAFPDGVWLVELAGVTDPPLVTQAVFHGLGLQDAGTGWSLSTLADYLSGRRLLLVLDNCEHVLDSCAVLASTLLRSCASLRILATSREPLGIDGEHRMRVPSLSLPDPTSPSSSDPLGSDAVALLAARAAAVEPAFRLDAGNAGTAAAICQRLDGIPLAIELAAARLETVGLDELLGAIEREPLGLDGKRGGEPRQRTLEATIAWSYGLLTEPERRLWTRLSVFAGGFDAAAAVTVCSDADLPAAEVPRLLGRLVEKSVLRRDGIASPPRYALLETLREFAGRRLRESADDELHALRRHRDWVRDLAHEAGTWDRRQQAAFARLDLEQNNLWAALGFCVGHPDESAAGVDICCRLYAYWNSRGPLNEARRLIGALLENLAVESRARADGLWLAAGLAIWQGDHAEARRAAEESLQSARRLDHADATAWAVGHLGVLAWAEGRPSDALPLVSSAIEVATRAGTDGIAYWARSLLCAVHLAAGDVARAAASGEDVVADGEEAGELWARGIVLGFVAEARWRRGDWEGAIAALREGFGCKRALDDRIGMASRLEAIAWMLSERAAVDGAADGAAVLLGCAHGMRESIGPVFPAFAGRYEQSVVSSRTRLGDRAFEAAFEQGATLSAEEAIAFALDGRRPDPGEPPSVPRRTGVPGLTLTRREREVASLVREGLTNREIADRLVVSERTAETHVWNIFNKLGLDSRAQLASWATVHGIESAASPAARREGSG